MSERRFRESTGMSVLDVAEKYNCEVYIHGEGDVPTFDFRNKERRIILLYNSCHFRMRDQATQPTSTEEIHLRWSPLSSGSTYDFGSINSGIDARRVWRNDFGRIAEEVVEGQMLAFSDFFHYGEDFSTEFADICSQVFDPAYQHSRVVTQLQNMLKDMSKTAGITIKEVVTNADFDKEAFVEKLTGKSRYFIESMVRGHKDAIDTLKVQKHAEIAAVRSQLSADIGLHITLGTKIARYWKIDGTHLVYRKTIIPKVIKKQEHICKIAPEDENPFFIKGLSLPINQSVITDAFYKEGFHPNIGVPSPGGPMPVVCIGSFSNKSIHEIIEGLPELMETINLDSAFDGDAKNRARELLNNSPNTEERRIWYGNTR